MNPARGVRWETATTLEVYLGGTELNIATNLVSLGTAARWISVLPAGEAGEMMRARLRGTGVDVAVPHSVAGHPGWYMLEEATPPRSDRVLARVKSVLGHLPRVELAWEELLAGAQWFHTSGVTAGLSVGCSDACLAALKTAKSAGLVTSYDLNFRKNLWDDTEAKKRQTPILEFVDVLVCSRQEFDEYFAGQVPAGKTFLLPQRDATETSYWLEVLAPEGTFVSPRFAVRLGDRVGVGDSMMAGWIHAQTRGQSLQQCTDFAAACGALKYSVKGDCARLHEREVNELLSEGFRAMKR